MSAIIEQTPQTAQERASAATTRLRQTLQINDLKLLSAAIAEAAAGEVESNPAFASRIKAIYTDLAAHASPRKRTPKELPQKPKITPLGRVEGYHFDPFAPIDPVFLLKLYGLEQLPLVLQEYTLAILKEAAQNLMAKHPDTKPKNRSKKADLIDYIVGLMAVAA